MSPHPRRVLVAAATLALTAAATPALAAVDGSNVVISEVYGGGGNSRSVFTNDFVELYNPTGAPIDVTGWQIRQQSAAGNTGTTHTLTGVVPAGGHLLIQGAAGTNSPAPLPTPDDAGTFNFSGTQASAVLVDVAGVTVDLLGWGSAVNVETAPAPATTNATSVQRLDPAVDTDDNSADFHVAAPTPTNSGGQAPVDPEEPVDPVDPEVPVEPGATVSIAEIQGTGTATPLAGQTVTTEGVVTGVYEEGGRNGFYLQTPGTGGQAQTAGDASHGIFVYLGNRTDYPRIGDSLIVTGQAGEHYDMTQLSTPTITVPDTAFAPVTPVEFEHLPAGDEVREAHESMLVLPTGAHTVTDNYGLNTYGEIGLAPGTEPFRQPTDVHAPDTDPASPVQQLAAEQAAQLVTLDDGRTRNYLTGDQATPLPYVAQDGAPATPVRTGAAVTFQHPVVVHFDHDLWRYQPTTPVTGHTSGADLPITWEDTRAAEVGAMSQVGGDYSLASFNVLNYFTTLGESEAGCRAYTDMHGQPVGARNCDVRGAFTPEAFRDQQAKIVAAVNELDVDVLGLEEIENTAALTGDPARRDEALSALVDALNTHAGTTRWAYVPSPAQVGTDEDKIRVGFIYNPGTVEPVGESRIFDDARFTGTARQPLAQEFTPVGGEHESFVAVVNHFKSKGSVSNGDADTGDGQGNNATVRANQSQALLEHLGDQADWADRPVFLIGDLNSYSRETAVAVLENAGYTNLAAAHDPEATTYQFSGLLGSLDHTLGNAAATERTVDADVWNINADESVIYEYSRRNYNAVDFYADDYFRSSDHDPVKVGFTLRTTGEPTPDEPEPSEGVSSGSSFGLSS